MFEVDLNNGVFREIDLDKSVFCAICGNEIHGVPCSFDIETGRIDVHISGYAFCKKCKQDFEKWASPKIAQYEKQLAKEFLKVVRNDKE